MKTLRHLLALAAMLPPFGLTGCVASKYKLASKETPPAVLLNLTAARPPVEVVLHSVIVHQGPGSWKKEAYWDEYVLSVVNRGTVPFILEAATLTDFQEIASGPGGDPWKLESESKTWWQKAKSSQIGSLVAIGVGGFGVAVGLAGAALSTGDIFVPMTATGTALAGAAAAVLVAAPVYAVTVVVINSSNKKQVLTEFSRRRLSLPATIAPDQTAQGSLFFRISPGPQRLVLRGRAGDEPIEVVVDLAPFRGLHLKAPPTAPKPPAAPPTPPAPPQ